MYEETLQEGTLRPKVNKGIIKLIPKDGDRMPIKNFRPTTLLNISNKILANILSRRIKDVLPKIICHSKIGYVKGRNILKNLTTY